MLIFSYSVKRECGIVWDISVNQRSSYHFQDFLFFFFIPKGAMFVLLIHLGYKTLTEITEVSGDFFLIMSMKEYS